MQIMKNNYEVLCSSCIHFDVCAYKSTHLSFLANAASDFDFIQDIRTRYTLYLNSGMDDETDGGWYITICNHSEVGS